MTTRRLDGETDEQRWTERQTAALDREDTEEMPGRRWRAEQTGRNGRGAAPLRRRRRQRLDSGGAGDGGACSGGGGDGGA